MHPFMNPMRAEERPTSGTQPHIDYRRPDYPMCLLTRRRLSQEAGQITILRQNAPRSVQLGRESVVCYHLPPC